MTTERIRTYVLLALGAAAGIYALWPPLEPAYVGVAGTFLGVSPLLNGRTEANT